MARIGLDKELGIEICLSCPYDDCIGDAQCQLILAGKEAKKNDRKQMLADIGMFIEGREVLTKEIRSKFNLSRSSVNLMIRQGKLLSKKIGKGTNSLRIIGVNDV